jgi:ABC-type amino acid transport substrate-binding protein
MRNPLNPLLPYQTRSRERGTLKSLSTPFSILHSPFFSTLIAVILATNVVSGFGQNTDQPQELTGTLKKIHESGEVIIGYRESSIPFSFLNARGRPIGYSIDIGKAIVDTISHSLNDQELKIKYVPITSANRFEMVISGKIDLDCGSTTNNDERQKIVAFSPVMFVAGTKLLVKRDSQIKSFRDLDGKTVVATAGTTNEKAIHNLIDQFKLKINLIIEQDHEQSYETFAAGKADAMAGDDVLLSALTAGHQQQNQFIVAGDFLSYDPYGIMYRKNDPQLDQAVTEAFKDMILSGDLVYNYNVWFLRPLPNGLTLHLPMSEQLKQILRLAGANLNETD